jgi:hypothetical protein
MLGNKVSIKRLIQGHLHPQLQHVSTGNRTREACVTGEHSSKELYEQFYAVAMRNLYMAFIYII